MSVDKIKARIDELAGEIQPPPDDATGLGKATFKIHAVLLQARREGLIEAWELLTDEKWPTRPEDPTRA